MECSKGMLEILSLTQDLTPDQAQMMAKEYKNRGGGYTTDQDQKDESQKHLDNWTEEEWQTKEGSGSAKKEDGTEKRYLPKKAWENMTEQEKEETDQKKQGESSEGKQYVSNTDKAKESRKQAAEHSDEKNGSSKSNKAQTNGQKQSQNNAPKKQRSNPKEGEKNDDDNGNQADKNGTDPEGEEDYVDDGEAAIDLDGNEAIEDEPGAEDDDTDEDQENDPKAGDKRKGGQQSPSNASSKKQKGNSGNSKNTSNTGDGTVGSKHMKDEAPAQQGSADRLPKEGQDAHWKALPGFVDGRVVEVLTEGKKVDGKDVKASDQDPKIVLKSNSSGKICVHKPEACFYD